MRSSLGLPLLYAAPTTAAPKVTTAAPKAAATTAAPSKGSVVVGRRRQLLEGTQDVVDVTVEVDMGSGNAAAVSSASDQLASIANSGLLRVSHRVALLATGGSLGGTKSAGFCELTAPRTGV